jgi:hypothetical protein
MQDRSRNKCGRGAQCPFLSLQDGERDINQENCVLFILTQNR